MEKNNDQYKVTKMLNLMVTEPYYLFHFLTFFSYIPIRLSASQVFSSDFTSHLLRREIQALLAFCVLAVVKMVKEETWEAFIADTLFYAEVWSGPAGVFLVAIALVMDYHLALWYMFAFLGTSNQLTPLQLETILTEGHTSRFWLVEFHALSSSTCIRTSRIFSELSITFSNKNLSFGIVDIGLFPNTVQKFGISVGNNKQLPTYILFENAEEVARFPEVNFETKTSTPAITKKLLCRHFELDKLLLDYVNGK